MANTLNDKLQLDDLQLEDDDLLFSDEGEQTDSAATDDSNRWKILIVDDEEEVHRVTKLAMKSFEFDNVGLSFYHAYSAAEARKMLAEHDDFAMVLLDVVMETDDAGLNIVNYIRKELENKYIRIVLRTGQPGTAPEEKVVREYDIDDYKSKTELTVQKLQTSVVSSLRAYRELLRIDKLVQERTRELAELNRNLLDSIRYAKRIQNAILPKVEDIQKHLPESFVLFKPKDIVSGDFYYFLHQDDMSIVSSIDCTGHGVPGAIMSMMAHNLLNATLNDQGKALPNTILIELDAKVRTTLKQDSDTDHRDAVTDGMDLSMLVINHGEMNQMLFAGAQRPLYLVRNGEVHQIPGSPNPIGDSRMADKKFEVHFVDVQPGDTFYLFTDGFVDQFGGPQDRKFTPKRFRELLIDAQQYPLPEQGRILEKAFEEWRGNHPQTDDVCVIGLRPIPAR